jgi:hypothetical protein
MEVGRKVPSIPRRLHLLTLSGEMVWKLMITEGNKQNRIRRHERCCKAAGARNANGHRSEPIDEQETGGLV